MVIGSCVQLKSGGPMMTAKSYKASTDEYECVWWDGHKYSFYLFDRKMLNVQDDGNEDGKPYG